jgi:hypothetical protein
LAFHRELLQNSETIAVAITGMIQGRTAAEIEAQGIFYEFVARF